MSELGADLDFPLPAPTTTRARPRVARSRTRNGSVAGSRSASNSAVASGSSSRQSSTLGSRTEPIDLDLEYPLGDDEATSSEEPLAGPSNGGSGIGGGVAGVGKRELEEYGEEDVDDGRWRKRRRVELVDEEDDTSAGAGPSSSYSTYPPSMDRFGDMPADNTFIAGSSLSSDSLYNSDIYEEMLSEVIHEDSFQTREPEVMFDDMDRFVPPASSSSNSLSGPSSSALSSQALPTIVPAASSSSEIPQTGPSTTAQPLSPPPSPPAALLTLDVEPAPVAGPSSMTTSAAPPATSGSRRPLTPSTPGSPLSSPPKSPTPKKPTPQLSPQPQDPAAEYLHTYSCPICFGQPTNATVTPCGHILCGECLFTAVTAASMRTGVGGLAARCPVCRAPLPGWDGQGGGVIGLKPRTLISL